MNIGIVPNPLASPDWPQIKAFLEPAAKLGGVPILEKYEEVWAVHDGGGLMAAATGRLVPSHKVGEIVLCGGVGARSWAVPLAERMCDWFRLEGMSKARIFGRMGWAKLLGDAGWNVTGKEKKIVAYERSL